MVGTATTTGADIHPLTQGAWLLVTVQMAMSLFLVVTAIGAAFSRLLDRSR